jgi:hypothetical protein
MLDEITPLVDAGAGAGFLRIYQGTRPATGGAATTLLAELTMSDPAFLAAAAGVVTADTITDDPSANAADTATWFRITDSDGNAVYDGDVGTGGSDLNLNTTTISVGLNVAVTSLTITEANP